MKESNESSQQCDACGRAHRVLHQVDGMALGETCREHYRLLIRHGVNSVVWSGREAALNKVKKLLRITDKETA